MVKKILEDIRVKKKAKPKISKEKISFVDKNEKPFKKNIFLLIKTLKRKKKIQLKKKFTKNTKNTSGKNKTKNNT